MGNDCTACVPTMVAKILVIVGGLNWGLVALDMNLVNMLLGSVPMAEKAVYVLVGASAVFLAVKMVMGCKK